MPIEIRQLVIRAVAEATAQRGGDRGGAREDDDEATPGAGDPGAGQGDLVAKCVREVLRELRKSRER
jgi:Family of unknown function (DUF5908)